MNKTTSELPEDNDEPAVPVVSSAMRARVLRIRRRDVIRTLVYIEGKLQQRLDHLNETLDAAIASQREQGRDRTQGVLLALIDLLGKVAWPVCAAGLLFMLWPRIDPVLALLPNKVAESEKITAGPLSLELYKVAERSGGDLQLAVTIGRLSIEATEWLLGREGSSLYGFSDDGTDKIVRLYLDSTTHVLPLQELLKKGLAESIPRMPLTVNGKRKVYSPEEFAALFAKAHAHFQKLSAHADADSDSVTYNFDPPLEHGKVAEQIPQWGLTERGKEARKLILKAVAEQLNAPAAKTTN
jgi:hypothetical protein